MTEEGFPLYGVVHLIRPEGIRARDLEQLRSGIADAQARCLFCHTKQFQLRHPAETELPMDDISAWVNGVVQDRATAERLSFAVSNRSGSPEELRVALLEVLDSLPAAQRATRDAPPEGEFVFVAAESVPLETGKVVHDVHELVEALTHADPSVWFFHLLEQPWFPESPSIVEWLELQGEPRIAAWLREHASAGLTIEAMRRKLLRRWHQSGLGRRVGESAGRPEDQRREAARAVVRRFVRRRVHSEETPE